VTGDFGWGYIRAHQPGKPVARAQFFGPRDRAIARGCIRYILYLCTWWVGNVIICLPFDQWIQYPLFPALGALRPVIWLVGAIVKWGVGRAEGVHSYTRARDAIEAICLVSTAVHKAGPDDPLFQLLTSGLSKLLDE
jgi:hypothetical protein